MKALGRTFVADESGSQAIEYGLIIALVSLGILSSLENFAPALNSIFEAVAGVLAG